MLIFVNRDLLNALRLVRDANLDIFADFYCLAMECKQDGNKEDYQYWIDRANDLCKENKRIIDDIKKISEGKYVL